MMIWTHCHPKSLLFRDVPQRPPSKISPENSYTPMTCTRPQVLVTRTPTGHSSHAQGYQDFTELHRLPPKLPPRKVHKTAKTSGANHGPLMTKMLVDGNIWGHGVTLLAHPKPWTTPVALGRCAGSTRRCTPCSHPWRATVCHGHHPARKRLKGKGLRGRWQARLSHCDPICSLVPSAPNTF